MSYKNILVTGASIAGPTLAYWLQKYGFNVTVVERSPELRLGGQNIDVKGPAWQIASKMGIESKIREANTTETGLRYIDDKDNTVAEFPKDDSLSMTQELEILRGDLVKILYDETKDNVQYIFGKYITAIAQDDNIVTVTFSDGEKMAYDLVLAAEGIGSKTRELLLKEETEFKFLKLYTSYFTIERTDEDDTWARWCTLPEGVLFLMRPDNHGTTRVAVNFKSDEMQYEDLPENEQKQLLTEKLEGKCAQSGRLIKGIQNCRDWYFDRISQVVLKKWSNGRIAITGDAAYCATPIAGKGTDLAMSGAYVLAGELYKAQDHATAFEMYEKIMRPYAEKCQKLPPGIPWLFYPDSETGVDLFNGAVAIAGSKPVKAVVGLFSSDKKKPETDFELPEY